MRLTSLNISDIVETSWRGKAVTTGFFKKPVEGRRAVTKAGIAGDRQADPRYHGGEFKAVYAYSADAYVYWEKELGRALEPGAFGENLTVAGMVDEELCVGDEVRVGTALLQAVQPRQPCWKLGMRFSDPKMVKRFHDSGLWGVYFRVL
ncbi:MOSC domain-containing protein, partial [bacterium]